MRLLVMLALHMNRRTFFSLYEVIRRLARHIQHGRGVAHRHHSWCLTMTRRQILMLQLALSVGPRWYPWRAHFWRHWHILRGENRRWALLSGDFLDLCRHKVQLCLQIVGNLFECHELSRLGLVRRLHW